jgi:rubrerythrin
MKIKGTKTEKNLMDAFAGESQARNKYTYFSSQARKEGYNQLADIFEETANNEKEHAKIWFKLFNDGVGSTEENLKAAAGGENYEHTSMYKQFADEARAEGFKDIALKFEKVGQIEKEHEERYLELLKNLQDGRIFEKNDKVVWICTNCGYTYEGTKALEKCPVCDHEKAYFEVKKSNY